jgi:hypothetical protein
MRISHGALDACLRNPQLWFTSRDASSHPYRMGYERALRHAIFHYHKTSAPEARAYLASMISKHNFRNAAKVAQIENDLEAYMTWANTENLRIATVQARIYFECGFLELSGEIGRVDVTTSGYRAIILRPPAVDWQTELRMPLIQEAVSTTYGRPVEEIEVGFQRLDSTDLQTVSYDATQLRKAEVRFRALGRTIRQLSQSRS